MLIIVVAFGVTFESLLNNDNEYIGDKALHFAKFVFWPIFGELKNLDKLHDHFSNKTDENVPIEKPILVFSYGLLMTYMIVASVLLLNLLIAMFR